MGGQDDSNNIAFRTGIQKDNSIIKNEENGTFLNGLQMTFKRLSDLVQNTGNITDLPQYSNLGLTNHPNYSDTLERMTQISQNGNNCANNINGGDYRISNISRYALKILLAVIISL